MINVLLYVLSIRNADVAELVDALVLGTSANGVGVRVPSSAPYNKNLISIEKSIFFIRFYLLDLMQN